METKLTHGMEELIEAMQAFNEVADGIIRKNAMLKAAIDAEILKAKNLLKDFEDSLPKPEDVFNNEKENNEDSDETEIGGHVESKETSDMPF